MVKTIAVIQIFLAIVGLVLLFSTEFGTLNVRFPHTDLYTGENYYSYESYNMMFNTNAEMGLLAFCFLVLFVLVAFFGFRWVQLSSSQIAKKYAKRTIILAVVLIVFTFIAAAVAYATRADARLALLPPGVYAPATYDEMGYSVGTAPIAFLVFSFLFVAFGLIEIRMTKLGQTVPPPPPPPPPPPLAP